MSPGAGGPPERGETDPGGLRRRAEVTLKTEGAGTGALLTGEEALKLVHELRVHQVELELQNEELQRTRREAEELRDRYADLYDFAPVGYVTLDAGGVILEANLTGSLLLPTDRQSLIGVRFAAFLDPAGLSLFTAFCDRVRSTGATETCDLLVSGSPGRHDPWYAQLKGRAEPAGEAAGARVRLAFSDITTRRRAEQALRESEARYRSLVDDDLAAVFASTPDGRIQDCNQAFALMFGFASVEEALSSSIIDTYDVSSEREALLGRLRRDRRIENDERFRRRRDGTRIHVVENIIGDFDDAGLLVGIRGYISDDTKRHRAEAALRESEEELRQLYKRTTAILESISDSFMSLNSDWRFTYINRRALGYVEKSPADVIGRSIWEVYPEILGTPLEAFYRKAMDSQVPLTFENLSTIATGRSFEVRTYPTEEGMSIFGRDVTERKRADEERADLLEQIRLERDKIQAIVGSIADEVWFADTDRHVFLMNPAVGSSFGIEAEGEYLDEMIESLEIFNPDGTPRLSEEAPLLRSLQGEVVSGEETVRHRATGELRYRHYHTSPVRNSSDEIIGAVGVTSDITERVQKEEQIRSQAALLEGINRILTAALTSDTEQELGAVCLDVAESITQSRFGFIGELTEAGFTEIAVSYPGWEPSRIVGPTGHSRHPGSFALHGIYGRMLLEGRSILTNDPATHSDSIWIPAGLPPLTSLLGVPLAEAGPTIWLIAVANRDGGYSAVEQERLESLAPAIVEAFARKQAEQGQRQIADQLRTSNEELQRFAYVASHDLQEPLRSIVSFSQLLERRYKGRLDQDADEFIEFIIDGGLRMQALIRDLLQFSRLETTAGPRVPTDPREVVAAALRLLETSLTESGGTVTVGEMPLVTADPTQVEQVFANLIGNAVKYRRPGVPPAITISAHCAGPMVEFAVADNGIGIEAKYFDRIFEMFRRLHTNDKYSGTGIGLAVVLRIVLRHGGRIWVESTPGEGSTFYFTLPAA